MDKDGRSPRAGRTVRPAQALNGFGDLRPAVQRQSGTAANQTHNVAAGLIDAPDARGVLVLDLGDQPRHELVDSGLDQLKSHRPWAPTARLPS